LLPLGAGSAITAYGHGHRLIAGVVCSGLALGAWLLILTGERSAWFGLGIAVVSAVLYVAGAPGRHLVWRWTGWAWSSLLALLFGLYVLFMARPETLACIGLLSVPTLGEHAMLWRQMIGLAGDYVFTGSGLGMTPMVASTYLFLLHVPLYYHAHNTLIQIALEQGVFGALAFAGMTLATLAMVMEMRNRKQLRLLGACGLASLVVVAVHGLLDSELYASAWAPVAFLPYGIIWGLSAMGRQAKGGRMRNSRRLSGTAWGFAALAVGAAVAGTVWVGLGGRSAWYTNVGAIDQTRIELSVYRWPEWPLQDNVRRQYATALEPALDAYRAALAEDPENGRAHRRIGQIALSQGDYALAHQHLLAAYEAHSENRAVRQLLGESYALMGGTLQAVELWRTIDVSQGQLDLRRIWHESLGEQEATTNMKEAIAVYERNLAVP